MTISHDSSVSGGGILRVEEDWIGELSSVELHLDQSIAKVVGDGIDNANGVSYIIDGVLVPREIREAMETARALWRVDRMDDENGIDEKNRKDDQNPYSNHGGRSRIPDYIRETNLHHWFYGRVGGTPQFRVDGLAELRVGEVVANKVRILINITASTFNISDKQNEKDWRY